jgi:hypothetical protein
MNKENKFVIINDKIVLGSVTFHRGLVKDDEVCNFGGGSWRYDKKKTL